MVSIPRTGSRVFPKFRDADFSAGNTEEFKIRDEQQKMWLGDAVHGKLKSAACKNESV
jgi:hypothetical protein